MMDMLAQDYMQNAFATGTIVAVVSGLIGFFVVLRGASFMAHALAHVGFAGAAGAVLLGVEPLWGLLAFTVGGATGMGLLGARDHDRDAATALLLVATLGIGALFLTLNTNYATAAFGLLFGTIVGIDRGQVWTTLACGAACLAGLTVLYRPLLLASVSPELAAACGVPVRRLAALFLLVVGVAAAVTVPVAGALLIWSLMISPAATAMRLTRRPATALPLAVCLGVLATWAGITLAYTTGWPVGFFITAIITMLYVASLLPRGRRTIARPTVMSVPPGRTSQIKDGAPDAHSRRRSPRPVTALPSCVRAAALDGERAGERRREDR